MIILFAYALFMLFVHLIIAFGIIRICMKNKKINSSELREKFKVSIIVPARNEEKNLSMLFKSLEHNMAENLEIILIDDRSTDRTLRMMNFFAAMHSNVQVISNTIDSPANMNPKHYALSLAEKVATGDILMMTDADCVIPPNWVLNICRYFQNPKVGLVFGSVITIPGKSFLEKYQTCDHLMRFFYTVGAVGLGNASGGFGNNMSIRRQTLIDIGGFKAIGFSLTEDAQLIAAVRKSHKWHVEVAPFRETMVYTQSQKTYKAVLRQELRWSVGGIFGGDRSTSLLYIFMMLYPAAGFIGLILGICSSYALGAFIAALWGLSLVAFLGGYWGKFPLDFKCFIIPCVAVTIPFYSITFLASFFVKNISWKDKKLKKKC